MRPVVVIAVTLATTPPAIAQVSGVVRDAATGAPVPGALVSVRATDHETRADVDGAFALADPGAGELVVTAAAVGYYTGAATATAPATDLVLELEPLPAADDAAWLPATPETCGACHFDQRSEWDGSPMARAGRNTWVADTYDGNGTPGGAGGFVYTRDSPAAAHTPASECAACHQPEAWVSAPFAALAAPDADNPEVAHGVSCDVCHKIAAVDETRTNFPGLHPDAVTLARPYPGDAIAFGVLGDVDFAAPGRMRASYQPQLTAAVCAACHQDKNDPDGDGDFEEADGVVSEPTYQEWLASPYADPASEHYATCADCHMPATGAPVACDQLEGAYTRPSGDVRSHRIEGTTPAYLENAVSVELRAEQDGEELAVEVDVVNDRTGHHVPTGVTIRNAILLVEASADDGAPLEHRGDQLVHELGGVGDPALGYVAGLPGKLYAKVNHGADGTSPVFYTDAVGITFDTRIPALATDTTRYRFALPAAGGPVTVRARLIYRRSWRALVDAKEWTEDGHGRPLADVQPPHFGHLMNEAELAIVAEPVPEPEPEPADDGGCACRAARPGAAAPTALALALALALGWRPRRQRPR